MFLENSSLSLREISREKGVALCLHSNSGREISELIPHTKCVSCKISVVGRSSATRMPVLQSLNQSLSNQFFCVCSSFREDACTPRERTASLFVARRARKRGRPITGKRKSAGSRAACRQVNRCGRLGRGLGPLSLSFISVFALSALQCRARTSPAGVGVAGVASLRSSQEVTGLASGRARVCVCLNGFGFGARSV